MVTKISIPEGLEDYISIRDEEVFIDWKGLSNLKRNVYYGEIDLETFHLRFNKVLKYLLEQEILTFSRKNSWGIFAVGGDFGPKTSYGQDRMNFTREEDAKGYLEAFHADTQFSVGIRKLI